MGRFQTTSQTNYDDIDVRATVESIVEFEPKLETFTEHLTDMKTAQSRVYLLYAKWVFVHKINLIKFFFVYKLNGKCFLFNIKWSKINISSSYSNYKQTQRNSFNFLNYLKIYNTIYTMQYSYYVVF